MSSALLPTAGDAPLAPVQARRRHLGMLVLVAISLHVVMLSVTQDANLARGSIAYWLLIAPAALLPLLDGGRVVGALLGRARLLLVLVLSAGLWHLVRGDWTAVLQLGLLVLVLTWVSTDHALFDVHDLVRLYWTVVVVGVVVKLTTDLNPYGLVPGYTMEPYGALRVSFFPNVAMTGILSLALVLVLTKDRATAAAHPVTLVAATYFLVFSFVRTAFIAGLVYVGLRWWFARRPWRRPMRLFWIALVTAVASILLIATSSAMVASFQHVPVVSTLLLQGKADLTPEEIFAQIYRPWLWWQQLVLFATSPGFMGWGSAEFAVIKTDELIAGQDGAGSEALLTRLLAAYGAAGLLFTTYILARLRASARARDTWACAVFPPVALLMMNWGSVFHPTDALFVIYMLMVVRGSAGFSST